MTTKPDWCPQEVWDEAMDLYDPAAWNITKAITEEYVIVRADGIAFLYLLLLAGCVSVATFCVLSLMTGPQPENRDKYQSCNKEPKD